MVALGQAAFISAMAGLALVFSEFSEVVSCLTAPIGSVLSFLDALLIWLTDVVSSCAWLENWPPAWPLSAVS